MGTAQRAGIELESVLSSEGERAANSPPEEAIGTLWELVEALQDAADELAESPVQADRLVSSALLHLRPRIRRLDQPLDRAA